MIIWCQLEKKRLNMRKSLIYMMKKKPVCQEDQALQKDDSATLKLLVLLSANVYSYLIRMFWDNSIWNLPPSPVVVDFCFMVLWIGLVTNSIIW